MRAKKRTAQRFAGKRVCKPSTNQKVISMEGVRRGALNLLLAVLVLVGKKLGAPLYLINR